MKSLNERIKNLRKEKGLTQLQLADMLNVTDKAVSKWEVGEANPDIALLPKIAQIFGVTLDYLLTGRLEEEKISLDDMDLDKRIHLLIKKDDAENFHKYKYDAIHSHNNRQKNIYGSTPIRFGRTDLQSINAPIWQEIIDSNANNIFNLCCDSYLGTLKDSTCIAVVMTEILDAVIKKCIDLDRDDFLYALGVRYFNLGTNDTKKRINRMVTYYLPIVFEGKFEPIETFNMNRETFDYFFEKADTSPKAFSYITKLEIKNSDVTVNGSITHTPKEKFTASFLYNDILQNAIKYNRMDLIESYFSAIKTEVVKCELSGDYNYVYSNTYIYNDWNIVGRLIDISKTVIDCLINVGNASLVKEMIEHNKSILKKVRTMRSAYTNKIDNIYVISNEEVDRLVQINKPDLTELDKFKLNAVKNYIVVPNVITGSRNLKLIRGILNNNYYHYYELVHDLLVTKNIKELFKFFVDNNLTDLANNLMLGETTYSKILKSAWNLFNLTPSTYGYDEYKLLIQNQNKIGFESDLNESAYYVIKKDPTFKDTFRKQYGEVSRYTGNLTDNPIIVHIKELKEKIYIDVEEAIAAEKKAKEDAIEREKVAKGLTKDYFEGLLSRGENELFTIKLCALQDAIFMYDYHYEGEDYAARLNNHFSKMAENAPKSRDCDDGWGYMVLDIKWEAEMVKPAQEKISRLRELFYRLRVLRNNISHPKKEVVKELTSAELVECLEYVFSINSKVEV